MDPIIDIRNRGARSWPPVVKVHPIDPYPRNRVEIVRGFVGKKVTVSTRDFHYAVGRLVALHEAGDLERRDLHDDRVAQEDMLVLAVKDQEVRLARTNLVSIQEADPALAEYVK